MVPHQELALKWTVRAPSPLHLEPLLRRDRSSVLGQCLLDDLPSDRPGGSLLFLLLHVLVCAHRRSHHWRHNVQLPWRLQLAKFIRVGLLVGFLCLHLMLANPLHHGQVPSLLTPMVRFLLRCDDYSPSCKLHAGLSIS